MTSKPPRSLSLSLPLLLGSTLAHAQVQEYRFTPVADTTIFADVAGVNLSWDDVSDAQGESRSG